MEIEKLEDFNLNEADEHCSKAIVKLKLMEKLLEEQINFPRDSGNSEKLQELTIENKSLREEISALQLRLNSVWYLKYRR